jgi:hypothetical protein
MNKRTIFFALILPFAFATAFAQGGKKSDKRDYGVHYTLPKTCINIVIKEKKTVYKPGELSQYADRYLKLSNVPTETSTTWELLSAKFVLSAQPDTSKTFFVEMNEKSVAPLMELTEDGIIKSINTTAATTSSPQPREESKSIVKNDEKTVDPHTLLTEDILMAGSTAKMAELVSKEIYGIRESRSDLVRGQADSLPKDGAQLKLMLDNLDVQEKALTSMFTGSYEYEEKTVTIPVDIREMNNEILLRFSTAFGVVGKNDLSGRPLFLTLKKVKEETEQPITDKEKKEQEQGVAYNLPGRASLLLKDGNRQVAEGEFPVTQFGTVSYLAPILFNKKSTIKVQFDPLTGALLKVDKEDK